MNINKEDSSPPQIFKETERLVDYLDTNEEKISQSENTLGKKRCYIDQLQQHDNSLNRSIAEKQANLGIIDQAAEFVKMKNTHCRNVVNEIGDSCNEAYKDINGIRDRFTECETNVEYLEKAMINDNSQYEKKIDELISLLEQLSKKRKNKLEKLKLQDKINAEEHSELKSQIDSLEEKEQTSTDSDSDLDLLENELRNLQNNLSILEDAHWELNEDIKYSDSNIVLLTEALDGDSFKQLDERTKENIRDNSSISKNLQEKTSAETELSVTLDTLEEQYKKLNEELKQTSKFWDDLQNNKDTFAKVEEEVRKIKLEIAERNEKYSVTKKDETLKHLECINEVDSEITTRSSFVEKLGSELEEMEGTYEKLQNSDNLTQTFNKMVCELKEIREGKEHLKKVSIEKKDQYKTIMNELKENRDKWDLELLAMRNNFAMEINKMETNGSEMRLAKEKLEGEASSSESEVKELRLKMEQIKERKLKADEDKKELDNAQDEASKMYRRLSTMKDSIKNKFYPNPPPPPPIFVKAKDFTKPKALDTIGKPKVPKQLRTENPRVVQKKHVGPKRCHWDSDSSMEAEASNYQELLKMKFKKKNGHKLSQ